MTIILWKIKFWLWDPVYWDDDGGAGVVYDDNGVHANDIDNDKETDENKDDYYNIADDDDKDA